MQNFKKNKKLLVLILVVILIVIVGVIWLVFKGGDPKNSTANGSTDSSTNKIVKIDCTSTASDQPQEYPGWKTRLYAAPLHSDSTYADVPDNGIRTFSIKELKAKTSANSLYFRYEREISNPIGGTKEIVEMCNSNNKTRQYETTATTTTTPTSEDASARVSFLHSGISYLEEPGDYRADTYIYVDGAWHFTDRIDKITLTD